MRPLPVLLLGLGLFASPAASGSAQEPLTLGLDAETAARRSPGGISYLEAYKRTLLYSVGANHVFQARVAHLVDEEIERRRAAGTLPDGELVSQDQVDAALEQRREELRSQNPEAEFWTLIEGMGFSRERYLSNLRQTLLFDRLFIPDDPDHWDEEVHGPVFGKGEESGIWDNWISRLREELAKQKAGGQPTQVDPQLKQIIFRPTAMRWLLAKSPVTEPFEGLPEGVAMRIGDREFRTDELLRGMLGAIGPVERERAAAWVEVSWAVREELEHRGVLLSVEEVQRKIREERKEYENSPISYDSVALQFLGFPSMELYHQHYRLRQSFRETLPDPIPMDTLYQHLTERELFLTNGKVRAEVILIAAQDMQTRTFPKDHDPFAEAEQRARMAAAELAEGANWNAVLQKYSDYPDTWPNAAQGMPQPRRGRFQALTRNMLRSDFLGENDYLDFLYGTSLGDHLFFSAEPGTVYGPVRGALGWYLYKLEERSTKDSRELDLEGNERHHYLVSDDYLTQHFLAFVDEVMQA